MVTVTGLEAEMERHLVETCDSTFNIGLTFWQECDHCLHLWLKISSQFLLRKLTSTVFLSVAICVQSSFSKPGDESIFLKMTRQLLKGN